MPAVPLDLSHRQQRQRDRGAISEGAPAFKRRAAAVRDLLRLGLAAVGIEPALGGVKSGRFGVLEQDEGADPTHGQAKFKLPRK